MSRSDPAPVAPVTIGGRVWPMSAAPLTTLELPASRYTMRIDRSHPDRLVIAPTWFARIVGCFLISLAGVGFITGIILIVKDRLGLEWSWGSFGGVLFWLAFVVAGVLHGLHTLSIRTTFDRKTRLWSSQSVLGAKPVISLDHLLAVQCLYVCHRRLKGTSCDVYEVNLIWKEPPLERKTVRIESTVERVRSLATELAGFLRVHLVDQIEQTKAHYERTKVLS